MSDEVTLRMTLDEAQAVAAIQRVINRQKQQEKGVEDVGKKYKEAAKEAAQATRDAERFAARVKDTTATPLEKVAAAQARLNDLVKRGLVTQQQANQYLDQQRTNLYSTAAAGEKAFGSSALSALSQYALGIVSIGTALSVANQAFNKFREDQKRALEESKGANVPNQELSQLADTPQQFQQLRAERNRLSAKYGIEDRNAANQALFDAVSAGFSTEEKESLFQAGVVGDLPSASKIMVKGKAAFPGKSGREVLVGASVAAKETQTSINKLAEFAPTGFVSAGKAGFSLEESLAIMAKFSDRFKGQDQAADRFANLTAKMAQSDELRGTGMKGFEKLIGDENFAKEFLKDSVEMNQAANVIREDFAKIQGLAGKVAAETKLAGTSGDAINRNVGVLLSDPSEMAKLIERRAKLESQHQREASGAVVREAIGNAAIERVYQNNPTLDFVTPNIVKEFARLNIDTKQVEKKLPGMAKELQFQSAPDPQMQEQTQVLKEVRDHLKQQGPVQRGQQAARAAVVVRGG